MQQGQSHIQAECGELRVITVALVAHECVRAVHLQPLEICLGFVQPRLDQVTAGERNVRILTSPDVQQFALDFACPFERVVLWL